MSDYEAKERADLLNTVSFAAAYLQRALDRHTLDEVDEAIETLLSGDAPNGDALRCMKAATKQP